MAKRDGGISLAAAFTLGFCRRNRNLDNGWYQCYDQRYDQRYDVLLDKREEICEWTLTNQCEKSCHDR